jgi:two-component system nitrogen regulation response regulator NtrX
VTFELPPLRERREDIAPLAHFFVSLYATKRGKKIVGISPEVMLALSQYEWKGNVRELENLIERAVILCEDEEIRLKDLPEQILGRRGGLLRIWDSHGSHLTLADLKKSVEKAYIEQHLRENRGNIARTSETLGIHKKNLHQKIAYYGINISLYRDSNPPEVQH